MDHLPLVTVAIPSFNHSKYVVSAINSVIAQTYKNIELIIVDDGSTDNSVELINEIKDKCQKRFVRFEFIVRENKGVTFTLKQILDICRGDFFTVLASDDEYLSHKIETQVQYLLFNTSIDACCGGVVETSLNGKKSIKNLRSNKVYTFEDIILFKYYLPAPTLMLRLSSFDKNDLFPGCYKLEDFYFYMFMTYQGLSISCLSDVLTMYRRHETNSSRLSFRLHAKERLEIINLYKKSRFYKRGYSYSRLIEATQLLGFSKTEGLIAFFEAVKSFPLALFSLRSCRFLMLAFFPKKFVLQTLRL